MGRALRDLEVLVLDCQASGATPAYGDLLELAWAICGKDGLTDPIRAHWIVPRSDRPIPWAVRDLTGWTEACMQAAVQESVAWRALLDDSARIGNRAPTVIHFARFENTFLRDLFERLRGAADFPFDTFCLHAVAERLFPDLPRRSIRALAGHLGHSPDLLRRSASHVEATAFIWRALIPRLEEAGVTAWEDLAIWLEETPRPGRRAGRVYPFSAERRRALPDRPGVYRFLRKNGDVLYVGKAASLRKRVGSHFRRGGHATERALEMLSQVHDVEVSVTESTLEAALLETAEIQRLAPPYNVQLRTEGRNAWFATGDLLRATPAPDEEHRIGPLPSERAVLGLAAIRLLLEGAWATRELRAMATQVGPMFAPEEDLFREGFSAFTAEVLSGSDASAARRIARASREVFLLRAHEEPEDPPPETEWDLPRVRRRLLRTLVQGGLLIRRTRWLVLLSESTIAFREKGMDRARILAISSAEIVERHDARDVAAIGSGPVRRLPSQRERQSAFDAPRYDRMRVLATELRRVHDEGGEVAIRAGRRIVSGGVLARILLSR